MSPRQQSTSRKHWNEANAGSAPERQAFLTISAIGITMSDLDGHYVAANTIFQKMVGYAEPEPQEFAVEVFFNQG